MEVDNLVTLVRAKPSGPVTTKLNWAAITQDEFERLLFNIVADAKRYTNPQLLTHTNAPDRGRDISVERVSSRRPKRHEEPARSSFRPSTGRASRSADRRIGGVDPQWPSGSHRRSMFLIVATSGRFTSDAVTWVERHNVTGKQPAIEMWPDSHLELLLARRPHLVAGFKLR